MNLFDVIKELQSGTAQGIDNEDVKPLMFPLTRMYYPYIPFAVSMAIMKAEFPLNWKLLKSVANGVKFKGLFKKVEKDDHIISIYKRKSDLGLKHANEICTLYEIDMKTLNMIAEDPESFKELQTIDSHIEKVNMIED